MFRIAVFGSADGGLKRRLLATPYLQGCGLSGRNSREK